jgi:predicted metal-dependent hydrolase
MNQTLPPLQIAFAHEGKDGIELYNQGLFWEAHEAWEAVWHRKTTRERAFYQAMIHVAAAMLKIDREQFVGAHSQLTRALARFQVAGPLLTGTNDEAFRRATKRAREELLRLGPENLSTFEKNFYPQIMIIS